MRVHGSARGGGSGRLAYLAYLPRGLMNNEYETMEVIATSRPCAGRLRCRDCISQNLAFRNTGDSVDWRQKTYTMVHEIEKEPQHG